MTNEEFINSIRLDGEEWKQVVGWEDFYMVSSYGRFLSLPRNVKRAYDRIETSKHKLLKYHLAGRGYAAICLCVDGRKERRYIHRMVAEAFLKNKDNKPQIDHIDGDKLNNKVSNLRWCTNSENQINPITSKKKSFSRSGKEYPKLFVPIVAIDEEKNVVHFKSFKEAKRYGFDKSNIHKVLKGGKNRYKGYRWMYLSDYESLIKQDVKEQS